MELSHRTIQALGRVITGDGDMSPYRSGPKLVAFFNEHGGNARYGQGFPSRWQFAEDELDKLNGSTEMASVIQDALDPRHFLETDFSIEEVVKHLNQYLAYDGYNVTKDGLTYRVRNLNSANIVHPSFTEKLDIQKGSHAFILEQIDKCREKLDNNDFDGAITNARSMVEAVFEELIKEAASIEQIHSHGGDLNKLFKEVRKHLNLDASQVDLSETLKQLLSGLNSIVTGIAGISNKMGDRHARKYKPDRHHALLAINTASALCEFLLASIEYQKNKKLTESK